jgi:hypothetical protein
MIPLLVARMRKLMRDRYYAFREYTNHQLGFSSGSTMVDCKSFSKAALNVSVVYDPLD